MRAGGRTSGVSCVSSQWAECVADGGRSRRQNSAVLDSTSRAARLACCIDRARHHEPRAHPPPHHVIWSSREQCRAPTQHRQRRRVAGCEAAEARRCAAEGGARANRERGWSQEPPQWPAHRSRRCRALATRRGTRLCRASRQPQPRDANISAHSSLDSIRARRRGRSAEDIA